MFPLNTIPFKQRAVRFLRWSVFGLAFSISTSAAFAQSEQSPANENAPAYQSPGTITGKVVDQSGDLIVGAQVKLTQANRADQEDLTNEDGQFSFANVSPGDFQLVASMQGFATKSVSGTLHSGQTYDVPQIVLLLASETEVRVTVSPVEIAEEEIKEEEKQRIFGIIPNFYVTYEADPAPLNTKQKMKLAWRSNLDPLTIAGVGFVAGIEQAQNAFPGYGQGAAGYGKRFGASYADIAISTFLGSALLPAVFRQDPRYFYQGTGSGKSRLWHAVKSSFMCRDDDKRWRLNYSGIAGSLATGAISNLYYPKTDRGVALTFETALLRIGESAGANIVQEFVLRKLTPSARRQAQQGQN